MHAYTFLFLHLCKHTHTRILYKVWLPYNILEVFITKRSPITMYLISVFHKSTHK